MIKLRSQSNYVRALLWLEFGGLFFGLPVVYLLRPRPIPAIPVLLIIFVLCIVLLIRDPAFERRSLFRTRQLAATLRDMLPRMVVVTVLLVGILLSWQPQRLFDFPRRAPLLWAAVMVGYPLLSVFPQEVIFRAFLFHRYRSLFSDRRYLVAASAVAFGFMHIVFENWVAVALTLAGGALFASTYRRTRSLLPVCVEHAVYGCLIFTLGWGRLFYLGALER
ncbi:MAG: CPBP family intramembrane metalloprotease [Acidobacteriota bacterium]|nr:MAG: CPBP family intramembrane metalloprotease [Acidobacteriota bacterium]